jgi:thiamine kinase-like enzyme
LLSALRAFKSFISESKTVLVHGDTDFSNFIHAKTGIGVIDWERACLGPQLLDISRVISATDRDIDIIEYQHSYTAAGGENDDLVDADRLADFSVLFEAIRWVCYYLDSIKTGSHPGEEWRNQYFLPAVDHIRNIAELM